MSEREPICGKCWAFHRARIPLEYDPKKGVWRCPQCPAIVVDPTDGEHTAEDIEAMLSQPAQRPSGLPWDPRKLQWRTPSDGKIPVFGGPPKSYRNTKSGRRRKKPVKRQKFYPLPDVPKTKKAP